MQIIFYQQNYQRFNYLKHLSSLSNEFINFSSFNQMKLELIFICLSFRVNHLIEEKGIKAPQTLTLFLNKKF